ncbi:hypothetical protein GDO81_013741 [Engystomops pustulosus]|uniref:Uncharacterized protein n=1 Tax=Engystomops pustulosus TaxID=76066 RepID=A0AAV7B583_ENGPU|nr:hypothetical protein GDO81_013741 [Engystomops pustulosus]
MCIVTCHLLMSTDWFLEVIKMLMSGPVNGTVHGYVRFQNTCKIYRGFSNKTTSLTAANKEFFTINTTKVPVCLLFLENYSIL